VEVEEEGCQLRHLLAAAEGCQLRHLVAAAEGCQMRPLVAAAEGAEELGYPAGVGGSELQSGSPAAVVETPGRCSSRAPSGETRISRPPPS